MTADIQANYPPKQAPAKKRKIPEYLIKETIDGIPFYYAGFESVLSKHKTKTDIMADSGLQSFIKAFLMEILLKTLDTKQFKVLVGEIGNHLDHRTNLALDLAIYDRTQLTGKKITAKYIDFAPKIVIEVDVRVELAENKEEVFDAFVLRKVRKLHEFGTEKIIWIFTKSKTIIVATPGNSWGVFDLNEDVEVMEGIQFNLGKYLESEGIELGEV
ncbi:MAG: Uma2 family endonuclease [Saprospiraceae bacterium]|nr:Uma2 family endonuclease [Saprospiraceae bacterium]MCF8249795.1 Uma2 family endonuclease [Saprospiraceae bacterium]MCF8279280.1 hypothetical protein [Bacteroidales bacterium]MCF8313454.1 Uma2 family endonuclease [Saprospiraceae bacterium]MCF8442167.1 Uma2 family endonuclease [Saprospiraceae bacterium]